MYRSFGRASLLAASLSLFVAIPGTATALRPTNGRPVFELADGGSGALPSLVRWGVPPPAAAGRATAIAAALQRLASESGARPWVSYREATGVPSRIFVPGLTAPGVTKDANAAEAFARAFLDRYVDLLAPGSIASDFVVVANDLDAGMRTIGFAQMHHGVAVRGGQISLRFKNDRLVLVGSEAFPFDDPALELDTSAAAPPSALVESAALAFAKARTPLASLEPEASSADPSVSAPSSAFLPWPHEAGASAFILPVFDGALSYRLVVSRIVSAPPTSTTPASRAEIFVDARSGQAVGAQELLEFASGELTLHVPQRSPSYGPRIDAPAVSANLNVDGAGALTSPTGTIDFLGASGHVLAFSAGPNVEVTSEGTPETSVTFDVPDGGTYSWDMSNDELADAQLSAFTHAYEVREYAKTFAPSLGFLDQQVSVITNIADTCNAYSDGTVIHFYKSGGGCENTGRMADVIYHEYGHSIHAHAIIPGVGVFEGALSEGIADYLAGTITGDHGMGRGFFYDDQPLRDLDPPDHENHWPEDLVGEVHEDGRIIAQTLWDLRKALVAKLGEDAGVARANYLFYEGIRRAVDIPSMYSEVLAADDDDGNVENGTPNACEINQAFALHGLRAIPVTSSPLTLEPADLDGYVVTAELQGLFESCPDDTLATADLLYRNERNASDSGKIAMEIDGSTLRATIPKQPAGSTVDYEVSTNFEGGTSLLLPDNAADPWYQFYVGNVEPLYCTDFETDPAAEGWTHGLSQGQDTAGADDWEWGKPKGTPQNGDPTEAFSGKKVYGNDLGIQANHDGLYQADKTNWAMTPAVDASRYDTVRLQYRRWLNVEDGHFDQATIYANGQKAWQNFDSMQGDSSAVDHRDKEWRFHDVDLTPYLSNGSVQVKFEIKSDAGKELGGWTLDDLCIVGIKAPVSDPCAGGGCGGSGGGGGDADEPTPLEPQGGCACETTASDTSSAGGFAAIAAAVFAFVRRGRARRAARVRRAQGQSPDIVRCADA